MKEIEVHISNAIMERPHSFECGGRYFNIYPLSLGKMYLLGRQMEMLGIKDENMKINATLELMRICKEKKDTCLRIIAYYTSATKKELFDQSSVMAKVRYFKKHLSEGDIVTLLQIVLQEDKTSLFRSHFGIDKETERYKKVQAVKEKSNSEYFFGLSPWGTMIDLACERYHWTMDYVVWGISYVNLQMLLADYGRSVMLTEKERKKVSGRLARNEEHINGDDKEAMLRFIKEHNFK